MDSSEWKEGEPPGLIINDKMNFVLLGVFRSSSDATIAGSAEDSA